MTTTQFFFITDGFWYTAYPADINGMSGAYCRSRYALTPIDGCGMLPNGHYQGLVLSDNILRIVHGGEYMGGSVINHNFRDFALVFDDEYHDEYKAGIERGYKGKRAATFNYFCRQSYVWQQGYKEGRHARELQRQASPDRQTTM